MTRKDYILVASVLAKLSTSHGNNEAETKASQAMRDVIAYDLAEVFKDHNSNFDIDKFLEASKCDYYNDR